MDVLHAQFISGHLTMEEIKTVLGSDFAQAWPTLQKKFTVDPAGKYFNVRLEEEKTKRANFTESRRNNLKSSHTNTHMESHMNGHMDNVNANGIKINKVSKKIMPFSPDDFYKNGSEAFEDIKQDEAGVERLLRIVQRSGYNSCTEIILMRAVRHFITKEEAKPSFVSRPKDEFKTHVVNWVTKNAKTLNQYG